jgi:chromosome segregation ATPase
LSAMAVNKKLRMSLHIKITTGLLACLLCLAFQGCVKDRSELEKKIVAHDPSFQKSLDNRNSLREQLDSQKAIFLGKEKEANDQISALKQGKINARKEYLAQSEKIKRQLQPEKRQLQRDLMDIKRQYKHKEQEIRDINKDINEISALIKKKDALALTQGEIRTWNERLSSLIEKKEVINAEKGKLEEEIEITKLKIKVLEI